MVVHDLIDRERHILLHLGMNQQLKLVRRHRRKLGEAREHHLAVEGQIEGPRLDAGGLRRLAQRGRQYGFHGSFGLPVETGKIRRAVRRKDKTLLALQDILGQHRPRCADIQCYDFCHKVISR